MRLRHQASPQRSSSPGVASLQAPQASSISSKVYDKFCIVLRSAAAVRGRRVLMSLAISDWQRHRHYMSSCIGLAGARASRIMLGNYIRT